MVYSSLFSVPCSVTMGGCTLLSSSPLSRGKDGGGCAHPLFFVSGAPALVPALFCMAAPSLSFCPSACTFPTRPPRTCHHLILRTLAPAHLALASAVTFTVDHTSFLSPCCTASSPLFSVPAPCPPNAATPPHTPAAHPAYTLHPRSLRPSSLHPAGNGDSTMQSLHSAITAPCNHLLRSTCQLPNSPSLRLPNKSKSRQVGKLASARRTTRGSPRVSW